jgi:hypothetical protein
VSVPENFQKPANMIVSTTPLDVMITNGLSPKVVEFTMSIVNSEVTGRRWTGHSQAVSPTLSEY